MICEKIGILGGTFDPVHYGHIQLAEAAISECNLNKIVFIPAAHPPHKNQATVTGFNHRIAMVKAVCLENEQFFCDDIESTLPVPSYSVDTLKVLSEISGIKSDIFFIVGEDSFLDFLNWKRHEDIFRLVHVVIAGRRGYQDNNISDFLLQLGYLKVNEKWQGCSGMKEVIILQAIADEISSSTIRAMFAKNKIPRQYLPKKVIEYIRYHKLYNSL